jgi:hypothetical protein
MDTLRIWEDKKWVRLERNAVVILAIDPLARIALHGLRCKKVVGPRSGDKPKWHGVKRIQAW